MPGSHQGIWDTSVNKAEKIPLQSLHWVGGTDNEWNKNVINCYVLSQKKKENLGVTESWGKRAGGGGGWL